MSLAWANTDVTCIHIEMGSSIKISQCDCEQCNASVVRQIYWLVPIFPLHKKHIILLDSPLYYNFRQSFLIWFGVFVLDIAGWDFGINTRAQKVCVCMLVCIYRGRWQIVFIEYRNNKKGNARVCWNVAKWNADTPAFGGYFNNPTLSAYRRKFIIYDTFAHSHSHRCAAHSQQIFEFSLFIFRCVPFFLQILCEISGSNFRAIFSLSLSLSLVHVHIDHYENHVEYFAWFNAFLQF